MSVQDEATSVAEVPSSSKVEGLRLARLRARNLRKIGEIDIEVPDTVQCLCLVGPNGGGKSSVLSQMVHALRGFSGEQLTDSKRDPEDGDAERTAGDRTWSTSEVGRAGRLSGFRVDWARAGAKSFQARVISSGGPLRGGSGSGEDLAELERFLEVVGQVHVPGSAADWHWAGGNQKATGAADFVARSVFLDRPSDRFETPYYEEPIDLASGASVQGHWSGRRLTPVRVTRGLPMIERFILDLALDSSLAAEAAEKAAAAAAAVVPTAAQIAFNTIGRALKQLVGTDHIIVPPWPFRRVGVGSVAALSLLSAGELDILVTVCHVAAQQVYLARKFGSEVGSEPGGLVFIDELDAHLHPAWQQTALPLLCDLFPTVQFVVTTHSPFVLRSLPRTKSMVVRLPDGRTFDQDFSSWSAEDILSAVFDVSPYWSPAVAARLSEFEKLAASEATHREAIEAYFDLASRSEPLRAACDGIVATLGDMSLRDAIRGRSNQANA